MIITKSPKNPTLSEIKKTIAAKPHTMIAPAPANSDVPSPFQSMINDPEAVATKKATITITTPERRKDPDIKFLIDLSLIHI